MSLKLITLNVQKNFHWQKIVPFIERESPDVLCLQELFECDMEKIEALGYTGHFGFISTQLYDQQDRGSGRPEGVALFSKLPIVSGDAYAYYQSPHPERPQVWRDAEQKRQTTDGRVVVATIEKDGVDYTIATTHFTWAPFSGTSEYQHKDMTNLIAYLSRYPALIIAGDFNIPRGQNEQYDRLIERFTDWVPREIQGTIDLDFHMAGKDPKEAPLLATYMVDYLFSTHQYKIENVRTKNGVSDHYALICEVSRIE